MDDAVPTGTLEILDILRILEYLPHRYPFLLIDRVVDIKGDEVPASESRTSRSTNLISRGIFRRDQSCRGY